MALQVEMEIHGSPIHKTMWIYMKPMEMVFLDVISESLDIFWWVLIFGRPKMPQIWAKGSRTLKGT